MFKAFIEHYRKRKIAILVTIFMAAWTAIPTYYLVIWAIRFGWIVYTIIFTLYMLYFFLCWHYAKDVMVTSWRQRNARKTQQYKKID